MYLVTRINTGCLVSIEKKNSLRREKILSTVTKCLDIVTKCLDIVTFCLIFFVKNENKSNVFS